MSKAQILDADQARDEAAAIVRYASAPQRAAKYKETKFRFDKRKLLAAYWVAEGVKTFRQICDEEVGISYYTLWLWQHHPEFIRQVNEFRDEIRQRIVERGVAAREHRIRIVDGIVNKQLALIEKRAEAAATNPNAEPGEETGLLVEEMQGKTPMMVYDAALTRELRENLKYVSQELGQFQEKSQVAVQVETINFTIPMGPRELKPAKARGVLGPGGAVEWQESGLSGASGGDGDAGDDADPALIEGEFSEVADDGDAPERRPSGSPKRAVEREMGQQSTPADVDPDDDDFDDDDDDDDDLLDDDDD